MQRLLPKSTALVANLLLAWVVAFLLLGWAHGVLYLLAVLAAFAAALLLTMVFIQERALGGRV